MMASSNEEQWARRPLLGERSSSAGSNPVTKQPHARVAETDSYPSPPQSASPRQANFNHNASINPEGSNRDSTVIPTSSARTSLDASANGGRRRGASLTERFAGDESHRPLDIIRKESRRAQRSPHLRKDRHHGVDIIDKLAGPDSAFHHEGPFDVVSLARNRYARDSPIAALQASNAEVLKATPQENVEDSISRHRPLDGVAQLPSGAVDPLSGRVYEYQEGTDMERDDEKNPLNRWTGLVDYHPEDRKGKGEPAYSLDRALRAHKPHHGKHGSESGIEMSSAVNRQLDAQAGGRARAASGVAAASGTNQSYAEWESGLRRSSSSRASKLASKFGSLTRRHPPPNSP